MTSIAVAVSPTDARVATFTLDRSLTERSVLCQSPAAALGSPLLEKLFALPGIAQVWVLKNQVRVVLAEPPQWTVFAKEVGGAIRQALADPRPPVALQQVETGSQADMEKLAKEVLGKEINPSLAQHGGRAELVELKDSVAFVRLSGGCQGCGAAQLTLRYGIERALMGRVPGLLGVQDITDHESGEKPYYAPGTTGLTPFSPPRTR